MLLPRRGSAALARGNRAGLTGMKPGLLPWHTACCSRGWVSRAAPGGRAGLFRPGLFRPALFRPGLFRLLIQQAVEVEVQCELEHRGAIDVALDGKTLHALKEIGTAVKGNHESVHGSSMAQEVESSRRFRGMTPNQRARLTVRTHHPRPAAAPLRPLMPWA